MPPTTAREVLDIIDTFFVSSTSPTERRILWSALSALRGPDDGNEAQKDDMTAPLRGAMLPQCLAQSQPTVGFADGVLRWWALGFQIAPPGNFKHVTGPLSHFESHALTAHELLTR